jgi:hypothetical protein
MVDDTLSAGPTDSICPWCSAAYTGEPDTCPACGAALAVDPNADPALPGLTAIDAAAIARAKAPTPRSRNRLLSWISGDYPEEASTAADVGALSPPPLEVRQEMLRLALEAEVANLQAEVGAIVAEAAAEGRLGGLEAAVAASDTPAAPPAAPATAATAPDVTAGPESSGEAPAAAPDAGSADLDPADGRGVDPA